MQVVSFYVVKDDDVSTDASGRMEEAKEIGAAKVRFDLLRTVCSSEPSSLSGELGARFRTTRSDQLCPEQIRLRQISQRLRQRALPRKVTAFLTTK